MAIRAVNIQEPATAHSINSDNGIEPSFKKGTARKARFREEQIMGILKDVNMARSWHSYAASRASRRLLQLEGEVWRMTVSDYIVVYAVSGNPSSVRHCSAVFLIASVSSWDACERVFPIG